MLFESFWAINFLLKVAKIYGRLFDYFENIALNYKLLVYYVEGQRLEKLGYFLFQHLVTLISIYSIHTLFGALPQSTNNEITLSLDVLTYYRCQRDH